jgi:hypothetical protein
MAIYVLVNKILLTFTEIDKILYFSFLKSDKL